MPRLSKGWHPAMLRGNLDPATLPKHPPQEHEEEVLQQQTVPLSAPTPASADEEYDIIQREEANLPQRGSHISQPISLQAYASRPAGGGHSPTPGTAAAAAIIGRLSPREQSSLGSPNRPILRATRTHSRDQTMFPADDDLPDQGHSRLNTSETAVEDMFAGADEGEEASTHASYSLHNFRKPPKVKAGLAGERPISQSDVTPMLQTVPEPGRPTLVHRDSPAQASQMASLTGTPGASIMLLDAGTPPVPQSEMSENATVRPSQEQRRSLVDPEMRQGGVTGADAAGNARVKFADEPGPGKKSDSPKSRKKLRDRLFRR